MLTSSHNHHFLLRIVPGVILLLASACVDDEDAGHDPQAIHYEPGELMPGGDTTEELLLGVNAFISPAENISPEHAQMFFSGNSFFNQAWVEAPASTKNRDGLGPLFNARSCSACHFKDGRGAPPTSQDEDFLALLVRVSVPGTDAHGGPLPDPIYGLQIQPFALPNVTPEASPRVRYTTSEGSYADGTPYTLHEPIYSIESPQHGALHEDLLVSPRIAPQMIGLGLLEAIPEERLLELEDIEDADGDGISGKIQRVWDSETASMLPGRFGWKGDAPTIRAQVAGAFLGDMGITTPVHPAGECTESQLMCTEHIDPTALEIDPDNFDRVVLYSSLLATPKRLIRRGEEARVARGKTLFHEANCSACHVPSHITSSNASLEETRDQRIWPYTDLLLHDMGEELSDERPVYEASGREWKTPPLWGIGRMPSVNKHQRLLHDGRADGVAEAILWHGGEGAPSRDAFLEMSAEERAALITFVESL